MDKWNDFNRLYDDGIRIEKIAKPIIEEFFKETLFHKIDDKYCYYDLINLNTKFKYEVKSYSCYYNTFVEIILPKEKIDRIKLDDNYVFILVFKNYQEEPENFCYYYITYDPEIFCDFKIKKTYIPARKHYHFNYLVPKNFITKIK